MATRYWVTGGTGAINSTSNWSATDGGGSGASVPTLSDDAIFNNNSGSGSVDFNVAFSCLTLTTTGFTGTFTNSSTINIYGNITLGSGMTNNHTGQFNIAAACTINTNGIKLYALRDNTAVTLTLASDVEVITTTGALSGTFTINNASFTLYTASVTAVSFGIIGTANIVFRTDGTWAGIITSNPVTIESGTTTTISNSATLNTVVFNNNGTLVADGSTFNIVGGCTINGLNTTILNNLTISTNSTSTLILGSDITVFGSYTLGVGANYTVTITGGNIFTYRDVTLSITAAGSSVLGMAAGYALYFLGYGTINWGCGVGSSYIKGDMIFNTTGKYYLVTRTNSSGSRYDGGTINLISGTVDASKFDFISRTQVATTFLNFNKIIFRSVVLTSGSTYNMNTFFSGSANVKTKVSSSASTNYIITFTDGFEKIAKFVKVSNCTITNRGQLLITTDKGNGNTLGFSNSGIRYINHTPNGISKNNPSVIPQACFGIDDGFVNDPIMK